MGGHSDGRALRLRMFLIGLASVSLALGCSAAGVTSAPGGAPSASAPSVSSTTSLPSAAPASPAATASGSGSSGWLYVPIGDSVAEMPAPAYAALVQQDLGVDVQTTWDGIMEGQTASDVLLALQSDQTLRDEISHADIITIEIPLAVIPAQCGGDLEALTDQDQSCMQRALDTLKSNTTGIFAEVVKLRSPSSAIIRATDQYIYHYPSLKSAGRLALIKPYWEQMNAAFAATAAQYHIPLAQTYLTFMGPNGDTDPVAAGLVIAGDEVHPTDAGCQAIAGLYQKLGYEHSPAA
jgi:hypothetical protein